MEYAYDKGILVDIVEQEHVLRVTMLGGGEGWGADDAGSALVLR